MQRVDDKMSLNNLDLQIILWPLQVCILPPSSLPPSKKAFANSGNNVPPPHSCFLPSPPAPSPPLPLPPPFHSHQIIPVSFNYILERKITRLLELVPSLGPTSLVLSLVEQADLGSDVSYEQFVSIKMAVIIISPHHYPGCNVELLNKSPFMCPQCYFHYLAITYILSLISS